MSDERDKRGFQEDQVSLGETESEGQPPYIGHPFIPTETPPDELFHYTSAAATLGILTEATHLPEQAPSAEIWATSLHFVNDSSELLLAMSVMQQQLRKRAERESPTIAEHLEQMATVFAPANAEQRFSSDTGIYGAITVCAFSLSEEGNQLSQWRAYCPPNGGYAIGFRTKELVAQLGRGGYGFRLARCRYSAEDHEELLRRFIDWIVREVQIPGPSIYDNLWRNFLEIAPLIKHNAFNEEREWRLVSGQLNLRALDLRASQSLVIPYCRIPLRTREMIGRIIVGPHPNQSAAKIGLRALLEKHYATNLIELSDTPYRLIH